MTISAARTCVDTGVDVGQRGQVTAPGEETVSHLTTTATTNNLSEYHTI